MQQLILLELEYHFHHRQKRLLFYPSFLQSSRKIIVEQRQKLCDAYLLFTKTSSLLSFKIYNLQNCLTSHMKHTLQKYFQVQIAEVQLFNKFDVIEMFNLIQNDTALGRNQLRRGRHGSSKTKQKGKEERMGRL